jgi:hypothetical protein
VRRLCGARGKCETEITKPATRATDIGSVFITEQNVQNVCRSLRELETFVANLTQHSQSLVLGFTLTIRYADSLNEFFTR